MLVTEIVPLIKSKSKNRLRVRLQDGADFVLYKKEIAKYEITEGEELEDTVYQEILEEIFIPRAKQRALHLLEKQDRTESNLRRKLRESGYPHEAVDLAVSYVKGYNYINDERYARDYIKYKSKTKSKKQTFNELMLKGLSKEIIEKSYYNLCDDEGLEELFNERQVIKDYISKKLIKQENLDEKEKRKIYNHLLRKGFSSDEILSVMREVLC